MWWDELLLDYNWNIKPQFKIGPKQLVDFLLNT